VEGIRERSPRYTFPQSPNDVRIRGGIRFTPNPPLWLFGVTTAHSLNSSSSRSLYSFLSHFHRGPCLANQGQPLRHWNSTECITHRSESVGGRGVWGHRSPDPYPSFGDRSALSAQSPRAGNRLRFRLRFQHSSTQGSFEGWTSRTHRQNSHPPCIMPFPQVATRGRSCGSLPNRTR